MSWFDIAAAGIGAVSSLIGGRKSRNAAEDAAAANIRFQKEFAQHGIRWRVEDAQAAGLHPLYALGAQTPTFSPVYSDTAAEGAAIAEAGQHIGRAVAAQSTAVERRAANANLRILENQAAESDLRLEALRSQRLLENQPGFATFPVVNEQDALNAMVGMTEVTPTQTPTRSMEDVSLMAGTAPMWREYMIAPGLPIVIFGDPKGSATEAMESLGESLPLLLATLEENERRYGPEWTDKMVERYTGAGGLAIRRAVQWLRDPQRLHDAEDLFRHLREAAKARRRAP